MYKIAKNAYPWRIDDHLKTLVQLLVSTASSFFFFLIVITQQTRGLQPDFGIVRPGSHFILFIFYRFENHRLSKYRTFTEMMISSAEAMSCIVGDYFMSIANRFRVTMNRNPDIFSSRSPLY